MDEKTMWEDLGRLNPRIESEVIEAGNIGDVEINCPKPNISDDIKAGNIRNVKIRCPKPNISDNYNKLKNKPKINGVTLEGNKTSEDLGINTADLNYVHSQTEASDEWVIVHNLKKYPAVSIIDSAGEEVEGNIHYDSLNQITITFIGAFKGIATLN